ncbi:hypothetical protein N7G274_009374 [Stereocaulon virgatum]|uniref:Octanoyltransferase n=1 Tax=Stereocaulon virgatum TaxID=373712 RepID=A0ABR3ZXI4_9LECA
MNRLVSLRHLHLPGLTSYLRASAIQDYLVRIQLSHKAAKLSLPAPSPIILTFQTYPTYTTGRRETLTVPQITHLQAGGKAEYYPALRGGQTTFHGPGQLTAYLVLDLKAHNSDVRSHVKLLEEATIWTCAYYGLETFTTENPGVWIGARPKERKLASLGMHVRRQITSHGLGINVRVDLKWFDRIIMCGLEGMKATTIERELESRHDPREISMREVADTLAESVAARLAGVNWVENVAESEVLPVAGKDNLPISISSS